jgi:tetratricopeptide (TPR) repeat protein
MIAALLIGIAVAAADTVTHRGPGFTLSYPSKDAKLDPPSAGVPFQLEYRKNSLVRLETERLIQPIDLSDESFAAIFMEVQLERLRERVSAPLSSQAVKTFPWGSGVEFVYFVPARSGKKNERDRVEEVVTTAGETLYRFTTWIPERDLGKSAAPLAALVASFQPEVSNAAATTTPAKPPAAEASLSSMLATVENFRRRMREEGGGAPADAQSGLAESLALRGYLTGSMSPAEIEEVGAAAAGAVRLAPRDIDSQKARAWAAYHRSQMVEMEAAIQEALRLDPNDAEANFLYALWYAFNPERSEGLARKAIEADPNFAAAYLVKALADERAGDLAEAREALERAVALDPSFTRARRELASVLEDSGDLEAALAAYRSLAREAPGDVPVHFRAAVLSRKVGRIDDAISEYQAALRLDPGLSEAHYNLAVLYLREKNQPELAAQSFRKFLELDPESDRAASVRKWLAENKY